MKFKKLLSHCNKRQIFHVFISENNKLIIEERDKEKKEVFYNCYELEKAKKIFDSFQLDEKYWIGIEEVHYDLIYFHSYVQPDLPVHKGIIAFDIISKKIIWQKDDLTFLFIEGDKIYCYKQSFDEYNYYSLNCFTGEIIESHINDFQNKSELKYKIDLKATNKDFIFPQLINSYEENAFSSLIKKAVKNIDMVGNIEFINYKNLFAFSIHQKKKNEKYDNLFFAIDIEQEKTIFADKIDSNLSYLSFDSFFIKDIFLFLLKNKNELLVFRIVD